MKFKFTPKFDQTPLPFATQFDGSREEAYQRAKEYAEGLTKLFRKDGFTIRIDRTDKICAGYEIDCKGHTV